MTLEELADRVERLAGYVVTLHEQMARIVGLRVSDLERRVIALEAGAAAKKPAGANR